MNVPGGGGRAPLIPALERQRQVDLCEFEAGLVYAQSTGVSSRTARAITQRKPVSKTKRKKKERKKRKRKKLNEHNCEHSF